MPANSATLTFSDDFNSLSLWNGASGTWATNFWYADQNGNGSTLSSNGEQQWYINADFAPTASVTPWTTDNGILTLTAAKSAPAIQSQINGYQYTSGELNTYHTFTQTYGYFEMRAELPAGQGAWPAFWLLPANGSWPPELDIFETLGKDPTTLYTTVHTNETGVHTSDGVATTVANISAGYHTYGVDWEAEKITWYFDGKIVHQAATPADMHQAMYMLTNLAVGGNWGGPADATTPASLQMHIDYVHVYSSLPTDATGAVITAAVTPTVTPPATGAGLTLTALDTTATVLTGGSGADTLTGGHMGDTLTGGAGADTFAFKVLPWNAGHITDFTVGTDKIDLSALLNASGYHGSDPVADGYLSFVTDGHGGTKVMYDIDGRSGANAWPFTITTLDGVSPTGLTAAQVLNAAATTTASTSGTTASVPTVLAANDSQASVLVGGAGPDTLIGGRLNDTLTGGGGADTFVFKVLPWNAGHVTDFTVGTDKIDLSALLNASGYQGSDPVADGYLSFVSDGHGGTKVMYDIDGRSGASPWPFTITTLDGVSPTGLTAAQVLNGAAPTAAPTSGLAAAGPTVLAANDSQASVLVGGAGPDTLIGGRLNDTLTGGGGADTFVFKVLPWNAGHVTDFTPGQDRIDLSALTTAAGYHGVDPIGDGYLSFHADGHGGTQVYFDTDGRASGNPWPILITTLDHVDPSSVQRSDWII